MTHLILKSWFRRLTDHSGLSKFGSHYESNGFIECWNMIQAIPEAIFYGLWQASKLSDAAGRRQFLQETIQQCLQNVPWMVKSASDVAAIDEM